MWWWSVFVYWLISLLMRVCGVNITLQNERSMSKLKNIKSSTIPSLSASFSVWKNEYSIKIQTHVDFTVSVSSLNLKHYLICPWIFIIVFCVRIWSFATFYPIVDIILRGADTNWERLFRLRSEMPCWYVFWVIALQKSPCLHIKFN